MTVSRDDLGGDGVALVQRNPDGADDGAVTALGDGAVPVTDRGFLYGDAVFETLRCYDGAPALVAEHAARLGKGLGRLGIPFEPRGGVADWLGAVADRLVAALPAPGDAPEEGHRDAYLRVSVTRGRQEGLLDPTEAAPTVVAVARPLRTRRYAPAAVATTDVARPAALGELKTHNYLPSVLARAGAGEADEALMRASDGAGYVSGAASNLVARVDGRWLAPRRDARPGVTLGVVERICADEGVDLVDRAVADAGAVEAALLTNSTWGVRRVASLDGRALADETPVDGLRRRYLERVGAR